MVPRLRRLAGITLVAMLGHAAPAGAQASLQLPLQFDFLNPGARSLALGSAFTGLADDATSGFTNPAGLTILRLPEVTFEGRLRGFETSFLAGGRLTGSVTNTGIDTVNGPQYSVGLDDSAGPSYISFVYPRNNWAIAGYRHEFVRVKQAFESNGVFQGEGIRELGLRGSRDLAMNAYGVSAAYRLTRFASIGASVVSYTAKMAARFDRYSTPNFYAAPTFTTSSLIGAAEQTADTTAIGFNLGGLFTLKQRPTGMAGADLVLGVVYRRSGRFDFSAYEGDYFRPVTRNGSFDSPDTFAAGLASHVTSSLTVTVDVARVGYSSLLDGYVSAQTEATGTRAGNFTIDDVTEIHGGIEYVIPSRFSPALRIGAWRDPNHSIVYNAPIAPDFEDQRFAAYLPGAGDLTHFTFGAGMALSDHYEINGGVDISSRTRVISLSAVLRLAQ